MSRSSARRRAPTWTRIDGIPLGATAADVAAPTSPDLTTFPLLTADGSISTQILWTGNQMFHCSDWMDGTSAGLGYNGVTYSSDKADWLQFSLSQCNTPHALECFEP